MLTNGFTPAVEAAGDVCDEPRPRQLSPLGFVELSSLFINIKVHFPVCAKQDVKKKNN